MYLDVLTYLFIVMSMDGDEGRRWITTHSHPRAYHSDAHGTL